MRVIVVGAGMVGVNIARELINEKRDVIIIEKNSETARIVDNQLDCMVINMDGSRPETLRLAKAETADWFIALTGSDAVNIVACGLVAAESPNTRTIARVETPFYSALSEVQKKTFGLDVLINPAMEAAKSLLHIIEEGFSGTVIPLHSGELQLRRVYAAALPNFIGKTLGEMRKSNESHFLVAAVLRNNAILVPKGDCLIEDTDSLYVLGTPDSLEVILGKVDNLETRARKILFLGATRITERMISLLLDHSISYGISGFLKKLFRRKPDISLLEYSMDDGKRFSQLFQDIQVIQGDSSEEGVLEAAGIHKTDLFIASTLSQSKNIITAQLAKKLGAKKTIAVTENHRFLPLGPSLSIDAMVCSNDAVSVSILEIIRKAHIRTIHTFYEDDVEIVELVLDSLSPVVGKNLKELTLPSEVLIAFIIKAGKIVVPSGTTVLEGGDTIGLVIRKKHIANLESIFGGRDGI